RVPPAIDYRVHLIGLVGQAPIVSCKKSLVLALSSKGGGAPGDCVPPECVATLHPIIQRRARRERETMNSSWADRHQVRALAFASSLALLFGGTRMRTRCGSHQLRGSAVKCLLLALALLSLATSAWGAPAYVQSASN